MKEFRLVVYFCLLVVVGGCSSGLRVAPSQSIQVTGDYRHEETGVIFPEQIGQYFRGDLTYFGGDIGNIAATYRPASDGVELAVYLYPAPDATEDRLRHEFSDALASIATISGQPIVASQQPFVYRDGAYRTIGLTADIQDAYGTKDSRLIVFECGRWFLKYRLTWENVSSAEVDAVHAMLLEVFSPAAIMRTDPLRREGDVFVAPAAFRDSLTLGSALAGAFRKLEWAQENVDSLEAAFGFPGLHLAVHTESLVAMVDFWNENRMGKDVTHHTFFSDLIAVVQSGFLNEFVMEEYEMLMLVPDSVELNLEEYRAWRRMNSVTTTLKTRYFVVGYKD